MKKPYAATLQVLSVTACLALATTFASAQEPPKPPPPPWAGTVSAGVTVTGGNSDVSQYNAGFEILGNPSPRHFEKFYGLLLRGSDSGALIVDSTNLEARDQYMLTPSTFVFVQIDYLRDAFKRIDFLLAPVAGVGYQLFKTDERQLSMDVGGGGVWESNPGESVKTSGALSGGESFGQKISTATTVSQSFRGLWKTDDFADSLLTLNVGIATALVGKSQLKIDLLDSFKNVPPDPETKRNDVSLIVAFVYKF